MPVRSCTEGGKPGYKWGERGKCYTYTSGSETSRKAAKRKAYIQGYVIERQTVSEEFFDIIELHEVDEGVVLAFGKLKGLDKWDVQAAMFDSEKFTNETADAWMEAHPNCVRKVNVTLEALDIENEKDIKVLLIAYSQLMKKVDVKRNEAPNPFAWVKQRVEGAELENGEKLKALAERLQKEGFSPFKAFEILNPRSAIEFLAPMDDGLEIWISGLGRWVMTESMIYKPEDQMPYVLHKDSPVPPKGVSWLPSHIEWALVEDFKYWQAEDKTERTRIRNNLIGKVTELGLF